MFYFDKIAGKQILRVKSLENVLFTTRTSFIRTKDENYIPIARQNMRDIIEYLGVEKLISPEQTHSSNIAIADYNIETYPQADALILTDKRLGIYLSFADCTPIILYDTSQNIGAVIHGGWRGTAERITFKTAKKMIDEFNSKPKDISAIIGPCISECCFEVGFDVYEKLYKSVNLERVSQNSEKVYVDLKKINKLQLEVLGISNIDICPYCTVCNNDKFFSYRKENGTTNRHSAILKLK